MQITQKIVVREKDEDHEIVIRDGGCPCGAGGIHGIKSGTGRGTKDTVGKSQNEQGIAEGELRFL